MRQNLKNLIWGPFQASPDSKTTKAFFPKKIVCIYSLSLYAAVTSYKESVKFQALIFVKLKNTILGSFSPENFNIMFLPKYKVNAKNQKISIHWFIIKLEKTHVLPISSLFWPRNLKRKIFRKKNTFLSLYAAVTFMQKNKKHLQLIFHKIRKLISRPFLPLLTWKPQKQDFTEKTI